MWDDTGYALDDPKHPSFLERWCDYVDLQRKREKEDTLSETELARRKAQQCDPGDECPCEAC